MDGIWTITELAERAAAALAADGSAQVSGRVRDLPNERLIRWYTTIGLVDPPLGRRGRTALYGPRHLLQLVAVKRLQAAGHSIAEIQIELAAATDTTLERIAALPPRPAAAPAPAPLPGPDAVTEPAGEGRRHPSPSDDPSASTSEANRSPRQTPRARQAARTRLPARPANPTTASTSPTPGGATNLTATSGSPADPEEPTEQEGETSRRAFWRTRPDVSYSQASVTGEHHTPLPPVVQGVRLASGLTLLLDVPTLSGDDLAAIENAARPLLEVLHRRGLLAPAESPAFPSADPSRRSQ
ncbi:helix-turn-helix domain-containing protein [Spirillospora sp. NBC_00431]